MQLFLLGIFNILTLNLTFRNAANVSAVTPNRNQQQLTGTSSHKPSPSKNLLNRFNSLKLVEDLEGKEIDQFAEFDSQKNSVPEKESREAKAGRTSSKRYKGRKTVSGRGDQEKKNSIEEAEGNAEKDEEKVENREKIGEVNKEEVGEKIKKVRELRKEKQTTNKQCAKEMEKDKGKTVREMEERVKQVKKEKSKTIALAEADQVEKKDNKGKTVREMEERVKKEKSKTIAVAEDDEVGKKDNKGKTVREMEERVKKEKSKNIALAEADQVEKKDNKGKSVREMEEKFDTVRQYMEKTVRELEQNDGGTAEKEVRGEETPAGGEGCSRTEEEKSEELFKKEIEKFKIFLRELYEERDQALNGNTKMERLPDDQQEEKQQQIDRLESLLDREERRLGRSGTLRRQKRFPVLHILLKAFVAYLGFYGERMDIN